MHDKAFQKAKTTLSIITPLAFYNPLLPIAIHVDASRLLDLGFLLEQKDADGRWRILQAGSQFLSETETRYAII